MKILVNVRAEADLDIAPYRRNMTAAQVEQLHKQYVHKRLLERCGVPRAKSVLYALSSLS